MLINNRENKKEKNKGITIVALIVTIIVLLILAGVTLATLSGDNGILTKAKTAKEEYKKAQYEEAINFAKLQAHTEQGKYKIDAEAFLKRVREILQKNELFKDARKPEENAEAWRIENKIDGDDNKWKLTIITAEDWDYYVTEENTKYIGIEEEIKTVIDKDIAFSYDDRWTQGPIIVTIEKVKPKEHEEYQIEYSFDKKTWRNYTTTPVPIDKNQYIYAILTDKGTNVTKPIAQAEITKIDRLKPDKVKINKDEAIITTDSITIIGEATDAPATKDYGQSGIATCQFSINGGDWVTNENPSYTFTGLTQNTTYQIKMKAIDHAGNERETEEVEIKTERVPELKEEDEGSKRANVTFSHDPVGWTNGNVTVTIDTTEKGYTLQYNIGDRNREEDWKDYGSPVLMTENGSIYARLKDNANNKGEAVEHKITTIEREKPTIKIESNTTETSQTKQIKITAEDTGGSELLDANYYQYYVSTSNIGLAGGSWQKYANGTAFTIGSGITGTRYIWVRQVADNAGNKSEASNGTYHVSNAYVFDNTVPTCTITANVNDTTNASSITYTFTFSEEVTGFTKEDVAVTNGTKGTFTSKSESEYTLVVNNTGSCSQTVSVAAEKCTDVAGNGNTASSKTVTIDRTAPTCTITANVNSPTNASTIFYIFEWSETLANNTFTIDDIAVANGIKISFEKMNNSVNKYRLQVNYYQEGTQTVSIAAGKCTDVVGNGNTAASKTITVDRTAPKCTITTNVNSPTNASSITYNFTWSEEVLGFDISDIYVNNGSKGLLSKVSSTKYALTVNYTGNCSQYVSIAAGTCTDIAGNNNIATYNTILIDQTKPKVSIVTNTTSMSKTKQVTITASDEGGSGFAGSNSYQYYVSTSNTSLSGGSWQNYTNGTAFTIGSGVTGTRYVWVKQIADNAGNKSVATTSNYHVSTAYTFDNIAPTITIGSNTASISKTKQITITAQDTGGSGLSSSNSYQYYLSTSNTTLSGGSWQNYTSGTAFTIGSGITGYRYIWVKQIADNAGNNSLATTSSYHVSSRYEFDNAAPTATVTVIDKAREKENNGIVKGNAGEISVTEVKDVSAGSMVSTKVEYYVGTNSVLSGSERWTELTRVNMDTGGFISGYKFTYNISPTTTTTYYIWLRDSLGNTTSKTCKVSVLEQVAEVLEEGSIHKAYYANLQVAVNECPNGGRVKLLKDYTVPDVELTIKQEKNITLGLNNFTIIGKIYNAGKVTVQNGIIQSTRTDQAILNDGSMNVVNCTIYGYNEGYQVVNRGKKKDGMSEIETGYLMLEDCTITGKGDYEKKSLIHTFGAGQEEGTIDTNTVIKGGSYSIGNKCIHILLNHGITTIQSGSFTSSSYESMLCNGDAERNVGVKAINIDGGTFTNSGGSTELGAVLYLNKGSHANITKGTLTHSKQDKAIHVEKGATLVISGGTITSNSTTKGRPTVLNQGTTFFNKGNIKNTAGGWAINNEGTWKKESGTTGGTASGKKEPTTLTW